MRKAILITIGLTFLFCLLSALPANWTQYYFTFRINDTSEIHELTKIISIDNVKGNTVWAYANDDEWAAFQAKGYEAEILPNPGDVVNPVMRSSATRVWDSYPTYDAYVAQMNAFATNYPTLCQIVDAGTTTGGRKILFAKISDNISTHEAEPEVLYTSSMHGDETTGFILTLRMIDYLLSNYATDTRVQGLVNNLEIWINPLGNPDGTYYGGNSSVSGARRYNNNGIDLNRSFPDPWGGTTETHQIENTIMENLANAHHFALSCNFHGGAEVTNYAWDSISPLHVDNTWFFNICTAYVNSVHSVSPSTYMDDSYNGATVPGVTNGYAWYEVNGSRADWYIFYKQCREVTIELSNTKLLPAASLPAHWTYNYDAMLGYLENALYGLQGIVTNGSGAPLSATINIVGLDDANSKATTDPVKGDYIRMMSPGTYTVEVSASGYPTRTFTGVVITANQKTTLNVVLGEATQSIPLTTGWNLISLRVAPTSLAVTSVFSGISGSLLQVKDTQLSYAPGMAAHFNTLSTLNMSKAYWVKVSANTTLNVSGTAIDPSATTINLVPGWNLVSYFPGSSTTVSNALSTISPYLQEVRNMSQFYIPGGGGNTLTTMAPNTGYWIRVSQACNLTYPVVSR